MTATKFNEPIVLGIDTCSSQGCLGLLRGGQPLGQMVIARGRSFSQNLLRSIDQVFCAARISPGALSLISVSKGPGSFTSLRVGLATAKGLAYTVGVPIVGVVSLEVLAWGVGLLDRPITAVLPARPGLVYTATYTRPELNRLECLKAPTLESIDQWLGRLEPADYLVGEGAWECREIIRQLSLPNCVDPALDNHFPRGEAVAQLGWTRFVEAGGQSAEALAPLYLQPTLAELRRCQ